MEQWNPNSLLPASASTRQWIAGTFNAYQLEVSPREFCSIASLYGALRHFHGICTLVETNAHASAFALLRVLWQALLNGAWLYSSCPEDMLEQYFTGARDFPKIPRLVREIEANLEHEMVDAKAFTEFQVRIGTFMHNHVHAGHQQMRRLVDENLITESFTPFEVNVLLFIATRMVLMAAALIALVVSDHELEAEVRDRLMAFSGEFERVFGSGEPSPAGASSSA
jgi:hypothetical protein